MRKLIQKLCEHGMGDSEKGMRLLRSHICDLMIRDFGQYRQWVISRSRVDTMLTDAHIDPTRLTDFHVLIGLSLGHCAGYTINRAGQSVPSVRVHYAQDGNGVWFAGGIVSGVVSTWNDAAKGVSRS